MSNNKEIALGFLVEECRKGSRAAQQRVFDMYAGAMYGTAIRITGNKMDAEDIVQETFVQAFDRIGSLGESNALGSWLKRITINKAINHVKKRKIAFDDVETDVPEEDSVAGNVEYTIDMVRMAMAELSDGYKVVFSLFAFEGFSHKEIAEELGITESTSKSQYNRAKKRIREIVISNTHG